MTSIFQVKFALNFEEMGQNPEVVQKINMKCVEARRPPKSRATPVVQQ